MKETTKWIRYRFQTYSVHDPRPIIFNPKYPFWESAFNDLTSSMIAWLPDTESLWNYWPDAFNITSSEHDNIEFNDRFQKPSYFIES